MCVCGVYPNEPDKLDWLKIQVVLTSDNGPVDIWIQRRCSGAGRDHKIILPKASMFDGGASFYAWLAGINRRSDASVCQMDLLASFAALLGQSYPDKLDSENTLDTFLGKSKKGREELVIEGIVHYAYRQGDWAIDSSLL